MIDLSKQQLRKVRLLDKIATSALDYRKAKQYQINGGQICAASCPKCSDDEHVKNQESSISRTNEEESANG